MAAHLVRRVQSKFTCTIVGCVKEYGTNYSLKRHLKKVHLGCSFCSSQFMSNRKRDCHMKSAHTGEKAFQCEECPAKFSTSQWLKCHLLVHTEEKPYKCAHCSNQFKTKSALNKHQFTIHIPNRSRDFGCSFCSRTYLTKYDLTRHLLNHNPDGGRFGCYFCKKKFDQRSNVSVHMRTHTLEKPFFCDVASCQFSSADSSGLKTHTRIHHLPLEGRPKSKVWTCYFCSKSIISRQGFVTHSRSHTLETPFTCGLCYKRFQDANKLRRHIFTHTMEKPFKCQECYTRLDVLQNHVGAVHRGEKHFFCKFCSYSSYAKWCFDTHSLRCEAMKS